MRKAIEDKTPLAAWATLSRDSAGMSVEEVVVALGERGHAVQAATIRGIEGGSKGAGARLRRLMAEVYGVSVPGAPPQATQTPDALVAALLAQTKQISELVEELRRSREARADDEARFRSLEAAVALQAQRDAGVRRGRRSPRVEAG